MAATNIGKVGVVIIAIVAITILAMAGSRAASLYLTNKGWSVFRIEGDVEKARWNLNLALKLNPWNPLAHAHLGRFALGRVDPKGDIYYPEANYRQAIVHYEQALRLGLGEKYKSDIHRQALENIAFAYWNLEQYDKAVERYREEIRLFPENSFWPRYFIATDYFNRSNKPREALDILSPAVNLARFDIERRWLPKVYALLARLYSYEDDFEQTEHYATLALKDADPNDTATAQIALGLLAITEGRRGNFSAAEESVHRANALIGSPAAVSCVLAAAYYWGRDYAKAISIANKIGRSGGDYLYTVCLNILAKSYAAIGDNSRAKEFFREYLSLTDTLNGKNIFVLRERENAMKELQKR